ncbi:MAG TPA: response regulator, partial [Solirubrobacteraceae bacterium]
LTNAQDAYVAGIRTSGHALMGVIGGILDFSKIEAGTLTIEPVEFEPAETVAEVCALLAPTVKEKRLDLRVTVDAAVPDRVRADAVRIRQVLTNLAGNAVKFTDAGEVSIRVALGGPDGSQLRFDVTDAGPGIEPGARPFEPFWQADSSMTRHHGGTGLGLAIAERMVELMGGEIHFESASSGGCHFWFTVTYENAPLTASAGKDLAGVRALLVDRDANRRAIIERQLNSLGLVVTASDDVDGALGALNTNGDTSSAYGVLIQGCSPADANIATQLEAMRATPLIAETPVLMIASAAAAPAIAAEVGADCTLTEPFGPSLLAHAVVRAMGVMSGSLSVAHPRSRGRLLLVEDDAINQLFAVDLLKRDGWEVEVAEDGGEAVELALKGGYDAILMDCQMPKVDGYRATEEIRRLEGEQFHTPIIAVTAHATARDRQRCIGAGMDAYVAKPFTTAQLESALHEGLNGSAGSTPRAFPRPATPRRASHRRFTPILDRGKLAHTDPTVAKQLVELFSRTSRQRISELETALIAGDGATIRTLGHTLKGAAATIGAHQMAAECERLRASVADGVTMEAHARHAELERIFMRTEVELEHANREAADV